MLEESASRIVDELPDEALVLDVGGWGSPFPRADWVLDLLPYETRGLYGYDTPAAQERFHAGTWVTRDICDHEPWPFVDDEFDFVVCSHTLEDIRDPIWVCRELSRVARAGYIETPSRAEEQCWGVNGPWVGWSHHRWLVDEVGGELRFAHKPGVLHHRDHFPPGRSRSLSEEERVLTFWWEGSFAAKELQLFDPDGLHEYLRDLPGSAELEPAKGATGETARSRMSLRDVTARLRAAADGARMSRRR